MLSRSIGPFCASSATSTGDKESCALRRPGPARITRGDEVFLLEESPTTYIPIGVRHRIENPGKIAPHLIEIQSGSYLGEDDIVRLKDQYAREGTTS